MIVVSKMREGGLDHPQVLALLQVHLAASRAHSPGCSAHALDVSGLSGPDIRFWTAWDDDALLGCGALRTLSPQMGEVKSMHTALAARRRGVARLILQTVIDAAQNVSIR
jgi:putative acetyltransferase